MYFHLLCREHEGRHAVAVADPREVEVQRGAAQRHGVPAQSGVSTASRDPRPGSHWSAAPVPGPLGVGQHEVRAGVLLDVLVGLHVGHDLSPLVLEHLANRRCVL